MIDCHLVDFPRSDDYCDVFIVAATGSTQATPGVNDKVPVFFFRMST